MSIRLEVPSVSPISSALHARCPRCGHGKLFNGFLDLQLSCGSCYLDYGAIDAGDGSVVSVALIGAAIIIGLAVWTDATDQPPLWLDMAVFLPLILIVCLSSLAWRKPPLAFSKQNQWCFDLESKQTCESLLRHLAPAEGGP